MKNIKNKIIAMSTAVIMLSGCGLVACGDPPPKYSEGLSVVFDYNDGVSRPYTVYADENNSVNEPTAPILKGHKFVGWKTKNDETGVKITFPLALTEDTTVYAAWEKEKYSITFDYNYSGSTPTVTQYEYQSEVTEPKTPVREGGYEFFNWQTAADGGKTVVFPYTVKGDATFYAKWATGAILRITLDYNYEGAPENGLVRVEQGTEMTSQTAGTPKRGGYTFKGWAVSAESKDVIAFPYTPKESMTLYAVWEREKCNVMFMYNYPDPPKENFVMEAVESGESVAKPDSEPTRDGHEFLGWYSTARGGEQITFPIKVSKTTRIYAHWKSNAVTTNIFDAEFTEFNPQEIFPGYSGSAKGIEIVTADDTGTAHSEPYPLNSSNKDHSGYYVLCLYKMGAKLTFVIYSDKDVSGVTLKASLAYEILNTGSLTISPNGNYGYSFIVNQTPVNYSPIKITGNNVGGAMFKSTFKEYTVSTNISLKKGENVIELVTNNANAEMGGTTGAVAPMVDYIKLEGDATFSWSPIYDNIYKL